MSKKDDFKLFVSKHPELITNVKNNNMTWQKYYEIYDLYGEDEDKWKIYTENRSDSVRKIGGLGSLSNIGDFVKKIDVNSIQKHVNTVQKAIGLFKEFGSKGASNVAKVASKGPTSLRPINKFFED